MVKCAIFIKTVGFVTTLSNLPLISSYLYHGRIVKPNTFFPNPLNNIVDDGRLRKHIFEKNFDQISGDSKDDTPTPDDNNVLIDNTANTSNKIIPADEEIVKRLAERHRDEISRYLHPLESGLAKQIPDSELETSFGKPMTPENLSKRDRESMKPHPYNMPIIPPTTKIPYFVNLDYYPSNSPTNTTADRTATLDTNSITNDTTTDSANNSNTVDSTSTNVPNTVPSSTITTVEQTKVNDVKIEKNILSTGLPINMESKDPLRELIDRNEDYPDLGEEYGPKWYLNENDVIGDLSEVELEDGWSILPCRKVYKHILQPSGLVGKDRARPGDETCVTFKFSLMDALTNKKIVDNEDVGGPMVTTYMNELGPVFVKCLKAMDTGEQAEFIFHVSEYNPDNMIIEELQDVSWLRLWINLWESHNPNERWWGLGPDDAHLYPEKPEHNLPKMKQLEIETDEIASQIETEMCTNPASPLWNDILDKMTSSQKESYVKHFDRQLENINKMKHSEFTGSRSFREKIKSTGQFKGYDLGHQVGGISKFFAWRETPFMMYIAIPVIPGLLLHITQALNFEPLDHHDERIKTPTLELSKNDEYDLVSAKPSVLIFLKKTGTSTAIWGAPFVNI
uniref:Uncharacterized protein n=1 Tax=Theileria parva TaxID=5875 RepID=Q4N677_THEPA|eukprot:XP_764629.1 hypothetical protein [Theileria parva strain Muguga]